MAARKAKGRVGNSYTVSEVFATEVNTFEDNDAYKKKLIRYKGSNWIE